MQVMNTIGPLPERERLLVLIAILLGTSLVVIDAGLVNVTLPTIVQAFAIDAQQAIWVATACQLATAMAIIPAAGLGRRFGMRTIYLWGIVSFSVAALACAVAPSFPLLVTARIFQGLGSAVIVSLGMALVRLAYPDHALGRVLGWYAMMVAVANGVSPLIGGLVLSTLSWKWIFASSFAPGLLSGVMLLRAMPNYTPTTRTFDTSGSLYAATAMASFIAVLSNVNRPQVWLLPVAILFAVAAWAFVRRQLSIHSPALHLDIFRNGRFSTAVATSFLSFMAHTLALISFVFLMEFGHELDALQTALLLSPWPIATALAAPLASRMAEKIEVFWLATAGLLGLGIGLFLMATVSKYASYPQVLVIGALCGFGFGFFQAPNNRELLGRVSRERSGSAAAVLAATRTMAMSAGTALAGLLLAGSAVDPGRAGIALFVGSGIAFFGAVVSFSRRRFSTQKTAQP